MKIGYALTQYWPAVGGAAIHTRHLAQLMARHHDVKVVAQLNGNSEDPYSASMNPATNSHVYRDGSIHVNLAAPYHAEASLLKLCKAMTGSTSMKSKGLSLYRWLLGKKLRMYLSDRDIIHCVNATMEHLMVSATRCARELKCPFVLTPLFHPDDSVAREALKEPLRVADAIIAQTEVEREELAKIGTPQEKIHVLSAGPVISDDADPAWFRTKYGIRGYMVLFLGLKEKPKGYHLILQAAPKVWREFPETRFVFAGPSTGESARSFGDLQDKRVVEIGELDPWSKEKASALAACDIFCMPSAPECSGVVFLEAWSFGKPVIAADIPTEREFVDDGTDGLLVRRNADDIARSLVLLLRNDELRLRMGSAGRQKVRKRFSWERVVRSLNQIYQEVVKSKQ